MRLIDADELLERMKTIENFSNQKGMFAVTQKMIENAPTVDPIKHGHWVYVGHSLAGESICKCSICGHQTSDDGNYCSYCGAKMEIDEKRD